MNADRHQRVKDLFQAALDRPVRERDAFLRETCGGDGPTLEEVRSLLKYHDPRTITPTQTLAIRLPADSSPPRSSIFRRLVPQNLRPANPDRLRASFIALSLAALLAALGYWLDRLVEARLRENMANQLKATLDSNVAAVTNWLRLQELEIAQWASHRQLQERLSALLASVDSPTAPLAEIRQLDEYDDVIELLSPLLDQGVRAVNVTNSSGKMVATSRSELQERYRLTPLAVKLIAPVFLGQNVVLPPMLGSALVDNVIPGITDVPVIIVGSPIFDDQRRVLGGLFATIDSGQEFTQLLDLGRAGPRGDTYAFGPNGQLLSASRYEPQLKSIGLIESDRSGASVLAIELRDPGVDLTTSRPSGVQPSLRPLTKMAAAAIAGGDGIDLDGYRDYRGVNVVGAWKWLEPYNFGVATEIDYGEAYAPLNYVRRALWSLFSLLVLFAGVAFVSSLSAFRLRREIGAARKLGQYTLEKLIGEGGMGKVYKARHALLRRPTAVKVLDGQDAGPAAIARFEREVQLASSLTHPNTVEIFDYGRSDDGIFYFAMEYLPGITLDALVRRDGPVGTPRVLHILRQILGALAEAHGMGLVHRDIKPANIILCRRGGIADFVKVVDFGLAKDLSFNLAPQITQTGLISGTPLYIAPECLDDPANASPLSDIYAVGAVTFLLTGRDLFIGKSPLDVLRMVGHETPPRASETLQASIPAELDDLVARCVAKKPTERPRSVVEMIQVVDKLAARYVWTQADAQRWWQTYDERERQDTPLPASRS